MNTPNNAQAVNVGQLAATITHKIPAVRPSLVVDRGQLLGGLKLRLRQAGARRAHRPSGPERIVLLAHEVVDLPPPRLGAAGGEYAVKPSTLSYPSAYDRCSRRIMWLTKYPCGWSKRNVVGACHHLVIPPLRISSVGPPTLRETKITLCVIMSVQTIMWPCLTSSC